MNTRAGSVSTAFRWVSSSLSVVGNVRKVNEDAVLDLPASGLWVVADGMGGHNAGDVASRMIVDELSSVRPTERPSSFVDEIEERLRRVNRRLYDNSLTQPAGGLSGSTVVVLATFARYAVCLWAGDSRIYRLRGQQLEQLTRDHSEAQELTEQGRDDEVAANANVITRAVGGTEDLQLDFELCELDDGDEFLLCSDGLYREVVSADIATHLRQEPAAACRVLIDQALAGTCSDNVSVIAVRFSHTASAARR